MAHAAAVAHLSQVDPAMARLIREVGPCTLTAQTRRAPFESLVRAIASQQLHGKAAESILRRFIALFPGRRFPRADDLATVDDARLRFVGFSRSKVAALRDLAAKTLDGTVPTARIIRGLDDEAIVQRVTAVRGIGRWTVEMLLIFQLGRPDVLPVDDLGVRNGFRIAYRTRAMPTPQAVRRYGERWRPYRTVAAWYLWRATERSAELAPLSPSPAPSASSARPRR